MNKNLLLVLLFMYVGSVYSQQNIFWRDEAANGNWENGGCGDIGSGNSQWWYPGFAPNQARNRPDCNDGSTTRHNLEIGNNLMTTMSLNTTFWGIRSLTLTSATSTSRTFNGVPDDATRGLSLTNGIYNNAATNHIFNVRIGVDAPTVFISTSNAGGTTTFNRQIFLNSNTLVFQGAGSANVTATVSGSEGKITKEGAGTLTLSGNLTYTGATTVTAGTLNVQKSGYAAAITNAGLTVTFVSPPSVGTYPILPGALASASALTTVGLGSGKTASFNATTGVLTVNETPSVTLVSNDVDNSFCAGTSVTFTATALNVGGGSVSYDFKVNGNSVQSGASNVYTTSSLTNGQQVIVTITVSGGFVSPSSADSSVITNSVTAPLTWYLDVDQDGYYTGEPVVSCNSPGDGYTTSVIGGGDCDDNDPTVVPTNPEICFDGVDSNCSGNDSDSCPVVVNITTFCGSTLPIINSTIKCSVPNLSFYGSGFTLGYRFRVTNTSTNAVAELDLSVPNFKLTMTDIYSYNTVFTIEVAAIVNGHVQSYLGTPCTVTTPDIPLNQVGSITCGTTLPELNSRIVATNVFGSIHYRFRVALSDAPTTYEYVISPTASMRLNRLVDLPMNFGKTYLISVQSLIDVDGVETYSDFGSECAVITPSVSTISVSPVECGQTLDESNSRIYINSVPNATLYRYRVALASNPSVTEDITSPFTSIRLTGLTGVVPLLYASDYLVSVQVEVTIDGQVFLSPFSEPCTISTPDFPETSIQASQCSNGDEENEAPYEPSSLNEQISATAVSGASYRFLLERYVNNELVYSEELIRSVNWFTLANFNSISPLEEGATYSISVGLNKNGIGPYGKDCSLIVPGASSFTRMSATTTETTSKISEVFTAVAYPNPFNGSFNLDIKGNQTAPVQLTVYDMMGRLLENKTITVDQANTANIGANYPTGVYNVVVTQGEEVKMIRVVKQ